MAAVKVVAVAEQCSEGMAVVKEAKEVAVEAKVDCQRHT